MSYLTFKQESETVCKFYNQDGEEIGWLEKYRVEQWMSWVEFLNPQCYLSASCQDEVREKTRELNNNKKKVTTVKRCEEHKLYLQRDGSVYMCKLGCKYEPEEIDKLEDA